MDEKYLEKEYCSTALCNNNESRKSSLRKSKIELHGRRTTKK